MLWVLGYGALLVGFGIFLFIRNGKQSFANFVVFERKAGWFTIGMSLTALVFGASAVFGMSGLAYKMGWNASWWTMSGVVCLLVLAVTFAKTVWDSRSLTLPDIISKTFGAEIRIYVSLVLFLAWLMVLAGQIIAGGNIIGILIKDRALAYIIFALIFTSYTVLAGQSAVLKSGWIQTALMAAGLVVLFILVYLNLKPVKVRAISLNAALGFGPQFNFGQFLGIFIPVGLSYLFGPDMYSRIFSAKDPKNAKLGLVFGAGLVAVITLLIVWIGILSKGVLGNVAVTDNVIPLLFDRLLKGPLGDFVLVALVSIPLSGADIILMTTATVFGKDILFPLMDKMKLKKPNEFPLSVFRVFIVLTAALATLIAFQFRSIIPTLLISYKIFTVGIVPLLFVALLSIKFGVDLKSLVYRIFGGIYVLIVSIVVLFVEMNWIALPLANYNVWLTGINALVLLLVFFLPARLGKKKGAAQV